MRFQNKVIVVTGASRGIGQAICVAFAKEQATVVGVARSDLADTGAKVTAAGGKFIAANADLPYKTLAELVTAAKAKALTMASAGTTVMGPNLASGKSSFEKFYRDKTRVPKS